MSDGKKYHEQKDQEEKIGIFWLKIKWNRTPEAGREKKMKEFSLKRFMNPRFIQTALSGSNKFLYPTNANDNNNELENLYKYYKSTGQVN